MNPLRIPDLRPSGLLLLVPLLAAARLRAQDALASADKAAHDWLALRTEAVRLDTEWRTQREVLASLAAGLEERAKLAEEKRDQAKAQHSQELQDLAAVQAKNRAAAEDLQAAQARLEALSRRLLALRPKLPPRLSDALDLSYRTLASGGVPPAKRMEVAMSVLNRCGEFDRLVSVSEDLLTLEGEAPNKYFETIYWGLSRGYALDRASRRAWLGTAGPDGWRWEPKPEAYDAVVRLIGIAQDKGEPDWIAVPAN